MFLNQRLSGGGRVAPWCGVALLAMAGAAHAQALPTSLQVSATLGTPSGMKGYPLAINTQGQVGGFATKAAGSVLKVGTRYSGPFNTPSTYLYWDPQSYVYPVVWTGVTPALPTRYKSNTNTSIYSEAATGSWLALSTNSAAKVSTASLNLGTGQTYGAQLGLTLTNGVYAALQPASSTFSTPPRVNRRGTLAGTASTAQANGFDLLVATNGQVTRVAKPAGIFSWSVVGIADDDQVLIEGERDEVFTQVGDTLVYSQYRWQKRCFVWRAGTLTEVTAPAPYPVVSVNCGGISPNGLVAAYVSHAAGGPLQPYGLSKALFTWRNGQVERFQTEFKTFNSDFLPRVTLSNEGWGLYDSALDGNSPPIDDPWLFINGQHQRLAPLVRPAIGSTDKVLVKSMNASGQMLAQIVPATGTARHVVLTPR
jgi:hypothetical protein